nr:YceD family protein [Falsarthrobacter nasiphocae]
MTLSVKDLSRSPGFSREIHETVATPKDFGVALVGVEEGSPLDLTARLESVHEGILVTGTAVVDVVGECGRCLDPLDYELDVPIQELYYFEDSAPAEDEEDEQHLVVDESIDLEPVVRTAVVSALPFQPVCREDCAGLCPECGARLDDDPDHRHEIIDPRWAALTELVDPHADTAP